MHDTLPGSMPGIWGKVSVLCAAEVDVNCNQETVLVFLLHCQGEESYLVRVIVSLLVQTGLVACAEKFCVVAVSAHLKDLRLLLQHQP